MKHKMKMKSRGGELWIYTATVRKIEPLSYKTTTVNAGQGFIMALA